MSRLLLTGSKGLLGRALTKSLVALGVEVSRFDIREDKDDNVLNIKRLTAAMQGCQGVVHLAAVSRVIWGEQDPTLCQQTNVIGTNNVLQCATSVSSKPWVLYASSREVYGVQDKLPVPSNTSYKPMNVYAHTKVAAEQQVLKARAEGMRVAIVRYSNVYGDIEDHADRVVPAFCRAAATGSAMRLEGADNSFDFTHLDDSVTGTVKLIELLSAGEADLPPLHLTTGAATTLRQLAELANSAGGNKSKIYEAPSRSYDVAQFSGATDTAHNLLGWQANITIAEGVKRLVEDFSAIL